MSFVNHLEKRADLDHNNSGQEFKTVDTEPPAYGAGVGGMAPSGIPTYQPISGGPKKEIKDKKAVTLATIFGKFASFNIEGLTGEGSRSDTAEDSVKQLKYEVTGNDTLKAMDGLLSESKWLPGALRKRRKRHGN